ncbi:MAG: hypothetical protein LBT73_03395 [Tannerellaceae bacterium]|jgi:hypothetical protein|nr:hypothetical protein [Tannerellaceae bacterium]
MIWKNILALAIAWTLVWFAYKGVPSYAWIHDSLLRGNYTLAKEHHALSQDQRREMKLGFAFRYINFIREQTPDSAVILMPPWDAYPKSDFGDAEVFNKLWRLRILHPRRIVDAYELDTALNCFADRITHVAIVNGWGYEHLPYPQPPNPPAYAVLPINP